MKTHGKPLGVHRPRSNKFSDKTRLGMGVKSYERQNPPVKITLKMPPWAKKPAKALN